jgi:hypothetical protein
MGVIYFMYTLPLRFRNLRTVPDRLDRPSQKTGLKQRVFDSDFRGILDNESGRRLTDPQR